ncbi:MAG TPA: anti-sigma factor [Pseudonocardia sp.]|nr:anti-sigma factor [Pseudonocardia sp.]
MSPRTRCAEAEQAVGWAMRVLEPADEDTFAEHLPTCPVCRETVLETEDLIWAVAAANDRHSTAPELPELRERLLVAAAGAAQTPPEQRDRRAWPELAAIQLSLPPEARSAAWNPVRPTISTGAAERAEERRRSTRRRRFGLLVATVLLAVIGLGGIAVRQLGGAQEQRAAQARTGNAQRVLGQITQPGTRHAVLDAPNGEPVAGVLLAGDQRQVLSAGLPANNIEHTTYVLWGVGDGRPVPVGTFDLGPGDQSLHVVGGTLAQPDPFSSYAISIENGRRAPGSPGLVVATGQVTS